MQKLKGLIAAPFTPMYKDGKVNLRVIPAYASKLKKDKVSGVFVCGTTGEGMFMTERERRYVAEQWINEQTPDFKVIVHVGATSLVESACLAEHARVYEAYAIGCMGPPFMQPSRVDELVAFCAEVASGAPELPFYYYHIPSVTGVHLSMTEFLEKAQHDIPNLAGIKFTHRNMMEMLQCMHADGGRWDILHGFDEELLCGISLGATAAIGSTYNYLAPVYLKLIEAFGGKDIETARACQLQSLKFVELLIRYGGGVIGGKPVMKMIGLDCGPLRLPARNLNRYEMKQYKKELEAIGFFDWV